MPKLSTSQALRRRFMSNTSGSVTILFALAAVPVLLAAGSAIDFARSSSARVMLQNALDSAALTAARASDLEEGERLELAEQVFSSNITQQGFDKSDVTMDFEFSGDAVSMSAFLNVDTTIMRLAGFDNVEVSANVNITIPIPIPAEVVMVLDYSGSMRQKSGDPAQVKYIAMRDAAINLIEGLRADDEPELVKFSLIPYATVTRVTLPEAWVLGQGDSLENFWTGCVLDRPFPYNVNGTIPDPDDDDTKWIPFEGECSGFLENDLNARALTSDYDGLVDQLEAMEPPRGSDQQFTHIPLGLETALNYISPDATREGAVSTADPKQYIIVLTDGVQTVSADGPSGRDENLTRRNGKGRRQGERNLEKLCEVANAKDDVIVVTVAFDLEDDDTRDRLANCAASATEAFVAEDGNALQGVFNQIKNQIRRSIFISS